MAVSVWPWPHKYHFDGIHLLGNSQAGQGTSLLCPELKVAFDVAFGLPYLLPARDYFISHAHMDHAGGIPYLISLKNLMAQPPPRFFVPPSMVEPMQRILKAWQEMEGHTYNFELCGVTPGEWISLNNAVGARPFTTVHRVPSQGYTLFQIKKQLHPQYRNLQREDLLQLKSQGKAIETVVHEPWISFTGDTQIEFLDQEEWVRRSRLLVMEVTYIDSSKSVTQAREWGHIHIEEFLERLKTLSCERVLLIHLSARHKTSDLVQLLRHRLPSDWQGRVDVFPRELNSQ